MKEIRKVVQKLSCEKSVRAAVAAARAAAVAAAYQPVQKHKVTPGILGWLNETDSVAMHNNFWLMNIYSFSYSGEFLLIYVPIIFTDTGASDTSQ